MTSINRLSVKICGESGQGINSIGEVVARALKKTGFYTFGYREYPSVIKGGYAFHQIDFSDQPLNSPSKETDILLCFSRVSFHVYLPTLRPGGQVIHMLPQLELTEQEKQLVKERNIKIAYLNASEIAQNVGGKAIMANVVAVGALFNLMNLPIEPLVEVISAQFLKKPDVIKPNIACLKKGYESDLQGLVKLKIGFSPNNKPKDDALLTGNHLIALGAYAAGTRAYFGYPMTPSSSILTYMTDIYDDTKMLVKQLDDEISVAQTAIGAMFMGTRALVATSGGGFDLMTESVSLSGATETPFVCILGQRPGPATGMPTWTAASDLNLAVYSGHGELPRCVIAVSDSASAYTVVQNAFNIAEKYQIPVIVLTDKQIAESLFQVENLPKGIPITRHLASTKDLKAFTADDRYKVTKSGISPRWLPGESDAAYVANSDEHTEDGTVAEDAEPSREMYTKRLKKLESLQQELPEPELVGPKNAKLTFVSWGSVKNTLMDAMNLWNSEHANKAINFLNYEYIYPVRTDKFQELASSQQQLVLIENNAFGQLGALLTQETGYRFGEKLLKLDGRPFFIEDIISYLQTKLKT